MHDDKLSLKTLDLCPALWVVAPAADAAERLMFAGHAKTQNLSGADALMRSLQFSFKPGMGEQQQHFDNQPHHR